MARTQQHYSPLGDNLNKLTRVIRVRLFTQIDGWLKPFPSRSQINFRWVNTSFYLIYSVVLVFFRLLNFGSIQFVVYLYVTSWTANILSSCHSLPFFFGHHLVLNLIKAKGSLFPCWLWRAIDGEQITCVLSHCPPWFPIPLPAGTWCLVLMSNEVNRFCWLLFGCQSPSSLLVLSKFF